MSELIQSNIKNVSKEKKENQNSYVEKLYSKRRHLSTISFQIPKEENLISHFKKILSEIDDINFNIFEFKEKLNLKNSSLMYVISNYIFEKLNLFTIISKENLKSFTKKVDSLYNLNPYHNSIHACDVFQTCYIIISKGNLIEKKIFNEIDVSSLLIATLIHDICHPGLSNNYQINKKTDIAKIYNNISPLENMHFNKGIEVIINENIFLNNNNQFFNFIKERMLKGILFTDGSKHNNLIKEMENLIEKVKLNSNDNNNLIDKFLELFNDEKINEKEIFECQQILYNFIIHSSDISNPSKKFDIYNKWTQYITTEFFNEGDLEKKENLPINFLCDRNNTNIPKSQIGFINFVVLPNFKLLYSIFPQFKIYVDNCENNIRIWNEKLNEEK